MNVHPDNVYDRSPYPRYPLEATPFNDWNALFLSNVSTARYRRDGFFRMMSGGTILDVGCGSGWKTLILAKANPDCEVIAIDPSGPSIELAQVGIKLELVDNRDAVPLPTGITTTVGIEAGTSNGSGLTVNPKLLTLINGVHGTPTQAPNVIQITYVNSMTYPSGLVAHQDISGLALFPYYAGGGGGGGASPPVHNYANNIFISTNHKKIFTVAHEIVHLLTNAGHYGPGQSYGLQAPAYLVDHNLMKFGTSAADGFTATKRVYQGQQGMIESPNNPNSTGL